jgi:chromosomal replication initiation ATPase DnaA
METLFETGDYNRTLKYIRNYFINKTIEKFTNVELENILDIRKGNEAISTARRISIFKMNKCLNSTNQKGITTSKLGELFGGRDHSTILNSLKEAQADLDIEQRKKRHLYH